MRYATTDEMAVYEALFLSQPLGIDGMVYLDVPPEESLRRCRQRGSESEMEIELDYLEHLETSHFEKLLKSLEENQFPVLVLDWRQFQPPATVSTLTIGTAQRSQECSNSYRFRWQLKR